MTEEEYKKRISEKDVLDHTTLNVTLKEVASIKEFELSKEIERVLKNNKIEKPDIQSMAYSTNYYKVDLSPDHIERIIDIFIDLEESHSGVDGEPTPTASFYASLGDKWSELE